MCLCEVDSLRSQFWPPSHPSRRDGAQTRAAEGPAHNVAHNGENLGQGTVGPAEEKNTDDNQDSGSARRPTGRPSDMALGHCERWRPAWKSTDWANWNDWYKWPRLVRRQPHMVERLGLGTPRPTRQASGAVIHSDDDAQPHRHGQEVGRPHLLRNLRVGDGHEDPPVPASAVFKDVCRVLATPSMSVASAELRLGASQGEKRPPQIASSYPQRAGDARGGRGGLGEIDQEDQEEGSEQEEEEEEQEPTDVEMHSDRGPGGRHRRQRMPSSPPSSLRSANNSLATSKSGPNRKYLAQEERSKEKHARESTHARHPATWRGSSTARR